MVHTDHVLLDTSILSPHPLPSIVPSLVDVYVLLLLRIEASRGEYLSPVLVSSAMMVDCCDFFAIPVLYPIFPRLEIMIPPFRHCPPPQSPSLQMPMLTSSSTASRRAEGSIPPQISGSCLRSNDG